MTKMIDTENLIENLSFSDVFGKKYDGKILLKELKQKYYEQGKKDGINIVFEKLESRGEGHLLTMIESCHACSKMYFRIKKELTKE